MFLTTDYTEVLTLQSMFLTTDYTEVLTLQSMFLTTDYRGINSAVYVFNHWL